MKNILFVVILIHALSSCTSTVRKNESLEMLLYPVHGKTIDIPDEIRKKINISTMEYANILDNDGNQYYLYWEVNKKDLKRFNSIVVECKKLLLKFSIFKNRIDPARHDKSYIKSNLYKELLYCIKKEGFQYVDGDGQAADSYTLRISRLMSNSGNVMPVGTSIKIDRKKTNYLTVFSDVKMCSRKLEPSLNKNVMDEQFSGFVRVNIEHYVDSFVLCMKEKSYDAKLGNIHKKAWKISDHKDKDRKVMESYNFY